MALSQTTSVYRDPWHWLRIITLALLAVWYVDAIVRLTPDFREPGLRHTLTHHTQAIPDAGRALSIERITQDARLWESASIYDGSIGLTTDIWWLRIGPDALAAAVKDGHERQVWSLEFARGNFTTGELYEVYESADDPAIFKHLSDTKTPIHLRDVQHPNSVFRLTLDRQRLPTLYFRIGSVASLNGDITLWNPDYLLHASIVEEMLYGTFYGGLLILFLYNLCMYVSMRQAVHAWYIGYLVGIGYYVFAQQGHGALVLFDPPMELFMRFIPCSVWITWACVYQFARHFLDTQQRFPLLDRMMVTLIRCAYLFAALSLLLEMQVAQEATSFISLILGPALLIVALRCWQAGNQDAVYFLIAWLFNIGGTLIHIALIEDWIPQTTIAVAAMPIGVLIEAILLSFSLADKIKRAQEAADAANERALLLAQRYSKQLERQVEERTRHLADTQQQLVVKQKLAAMGTLTAGIAHEVNNPNNFVSVGLQNIANWRDSMERLLDELLDDEADPRIKRNFIERFSSLTEQLNIIASGSERISRIVNGVRVITRIDESQRKDVDVVEGLIQAIVFFRPVMGHNIEFHLDITDRPRVFCWAAEVNNAFMGLLMNAIQAVRERQDQTSGPFIGSIRVTSAIVETSNRTLLRITLEDNGCGMSPEVLSRAFDPFYTGRDRNTGAGLGLATARETIEKHEGDITLTSEPNSGTMVTVMLPVSSMDLVRRTSVG